MANNPLECRYWTQCYTVDNHVMFGETTQYYLQRDFTDMIYDIHVDRYMLEIQLYIFFFHNTINKIVSPLNYCIFAQIVYYECFYYDVKYYWA